MRNSARQRYATLVDEYVTVHGLADPASTDRARYDALIAAFDAMPLWARLREGTVGDAIHRAIYGLDQRPPFRLGDLVTVPNCAWPTTTWRVAGGNQASLRLVTDPAVDGALDLHRPAADLRPA